MIRYLLCCLLLSPASTVLTGIDVLAADNFRLLSTGRVGLITNHTGVDRLGNSDIHLLHRAANVDLVRVFTPEHGISGTLDVPVIRDGVETMSGIPITSLYGDIRRPTATVLEDIDILVFDIQDIGTRFYTYISTMGEAMHAAAENNIRFVVLDRPNPINGSTIAGPLLDEGRQSFVGFHRLPIRHGMTIGELARMFKTELQLDLDLEIIRMEGWSRADYFDGTGLSWIDPSPNMRNLTEEILYPGIGLLEYTNLSVGRGTGTPFELFGAPWLDGDLFARELNVLNLPGVHFAAVNFTPSASKFAAERCGGVEITITDRRQYESVRTGIEIALKLRRIYPDEWQIDAYDRLLTNQAVLEAIRLGQSYAEIEDIFHPGLVDFIQRRSAFLIYD